MDLTKLCLPDAVNVSGKFYKIHTAHPYWFRFAQLLGKDKAYLVEFDFLYLTDKPEDRQAGFEALYDFYYQKKELPKVEDDDGVRVLDYDMDSDLIYSAFMQCYKIDLCNKEIHWHKIRSMMSGLTGTKLNDIMGYRCYTGKDKDMLRMKRMWSLPEVMTAEDKQALERFNAQFK